MSSDVRYVGTWWLPDTPDQKLGGTLEVDAEGKANLEIAGELIGNRAVEIIHGLASGKQITLANSLRVGGGTTISQVTTRHEIIRANYVFVGAHLASMDDALFTEIQVEIAYLTTWTGYSGISRKLESDPETKHFKSAEFGLEFPNGITVKLEKLGQEIEILWSASTGIDRLAQGHDLHVVESAKLKVQVDSPSPWSEFSQAIRGIQNLVTLATRQPCAVRSHVLGVPQEDSHPWPVPLFFNQSETWNDTEAESHRFLFHLSSLGDDHSNALNKWFNLIEQIGLPLDVLFGLDYSPPTYYENQIFNAASAAEGFHKALCPESRGIDRDVHAKLKQEVAEAFADHAEINWIKGRINDNYPGFVQRMTELAAIVDPEVSNQLLGDVKTWAQWLRNARNAIGHLNTGELESGVKDENARHRLSYVTQALLHLVLLEKIGVPKEQQLRAVNDIYGYASRIFKCAVNAHLARKGK